MFSTVSGWVYNFGEWVIWNVGPYCAAFWGYYFDAIGAGLDWLGIGG